MDLKTKKIIKIWLGFILFMIVVQVILGGITRLTGSGLSITKWDVVVGSVPPTNADAWQHEFDLYKESPQYKKINDGMSLSEFKFIYFWEFIHRFWGRLIGLVLFLPLIVLLLQKRLDKPFVFGISIAIILLGIVGSFGWIMVESGLSDKPWVSPYKLALHLGLALALYGYVIWLLLKTVKGNQHYIGKGFKHNWLIISILVLVILQIGLGGLMSGMKAGLYYPTWPSMKGAFIPESMALKHWSVAAFGNYDTNLFVPAFVQFFHRLTAYIIVVLVPVFMFLSLKHTKSKGLKIGIYSVGILTLTQVILGILTVINCVGSVPLGLGVYHQAGALLLFGATVYVYFHFKFNKQVL